MEVHAELKTNSKMFCGCKNDPFHAPEPNCFTCPVCLGMPGALPVPNQMAIDWTIKLGLALNCKINLKSKFDRKHYFYPDLAKGFQLSQYDLPFCYDGQLETEFGWVRINRIHLEEDTAKLHHTTLEGEEVSLIDFNRSGVPLIEIVTEPDITSPAHAKVYAKQLRQLIRYLDIGDCDMEQGGMRLEANISLKPVGQTELPKYKVEVKNINSFRFLEQAISYEIERQTELLEQGETPVQETRGYRPDSGQTVSQRTKESAADYRYFPEPDIPPLEFDHVYLDRLRSELPLLPAAVISSWNTEYGVEERFSSQLITDQRSVALFSMVFEELAAQQLDPNKLASDVVNGKVNVPDNPNQNIDQAAKQLVATFKDMYATNQLDPAELAPIVAELKTEFADQYQQYKDGKEQLLNFFMGQTMKRLGKKVDAGEVRKWLRENLI